MVRVASAELFAEARRAAVRLLGHGPGRCLDLGCGTGAAVSILTHTDLDDLRVAFSEARRVLRSGRTFVYLGVHPCFGSPAVERREGEPALLHPEYRRTGWQTESRNFSEAGIRSRVGTNHLPLAAFLNALLDSGFEPNQFEEPGELDPPLFLALRATA